MNRFPLSWPIGWPRTKYPDRSRFGHKFFSEIRDKLIFTIEDKLFGENLILSTNIELRIDGLPYSNRRQPDDKGVAVYFDLDGKKVVLACDRWDKIEHNMYAIYMHIEAMRGQMRWGVGSLNQAFTAYTAIPETSSFKNYFEGSENIRQRFVQLCKEMHPDKGGDTQEFAEMNRQYRELLNH